MIDSQQASEALNDIDVIVRRVRQSQIYNLSSLLMIMWGVLVFAGNIAIYGWPRYGNHWFAVYLAGLLGSFVISAAGYRRTGVRTFNLRMAIAFALFVSFGFFATTILGHFTPRQAGTFWPIYYMLFYSIAGLWFGYAFIAIGFGITVLTLIGYFYIGAAFPLWMAFVSGGGLILGGCWMRRI